MCMLLTSCVNSSFVANIGDKGKFTMHCSAHICNWEMDFTSTEDITMAHLHCGINTGPVGVPLFHGALQYKGKFSPGDFTQDCWRLPIVEGDQEDRFNLFFADIKKGKVFVMLHSKQHPGGYIQGVIKEQFLSRMLSIPSRYFSN